VRILRLNVLSCLYALTLATASVPVTAESLARPSAAALMDALMWGTEPIGGPFTLTDHTGRRRSDTEFHGKLLLIYFGYMFCPDICPTDLQAMAAAIETLGPAGDRVQPLFITIDPERDTPAQLASYVTAFHPRLVGLTGSVAEIESVARAYRVYFAKAEDPRSTQYLIDHSGFIYLVNADGTYLGFFRRARPPNAWWRSCGRCSRSERRRFGTISSRRSAR
jgi:cytochrome oxidase Cu insertion factor (SCO1/SenC/PrrC family)